MRTLIFAAIFAALSSPSLAEDSSLLERKLQQYVTSEYGVLRQDDLPANEVADMATYAVRMELSRFGLPKDTDLENVRRFVAMVRRAESSGNRWAESSVGAMSFFQFKKASVITVINRLQNWHNRHGFGPLPPWAVVLRENPSAIFQLNESLQAMLMIINIIEQPGSDEFLWRLIIGDTEAAKPLYYRYHHTSPDNPTIALIERVHLKYFGE